MLGANSNEHQFFHLFLRLMLTLFRHTVPSIWFAKKMHQLNKFNYISSLSTKALWSFSINGMLRYVDLLYSAQGEVAVTVTVAVAMQRHTCGGRSHCSQPTANKIKTNCCAPAFLIETMNQN